MFSSSFLGGVCVCVWGKIIGYCDYLMGWLMDFMEFNVRCNKNEKICIIYVF